MTQDEETYAFTAARASQRERLTAIETLLDAGTIRHLDALGARPGWQCLEVGAGGGSIALWLCDRVAPGGSVIAVDLDPSHLRDLRAPENLEVRRHDVQLDELPDATFDLVHFRLVLAWLDDRERALARLIAALKPGGWLLAEEMDFVSAVPDPRLQAGAREAFEHAVAAHNEVLRAQHVFDPFYGRRVTGDLAAAGLVDVGSEGRAGMWRGGEAGGTAWRLTLAQLAEPMVATGLVATDELDRVAALCDDPSFSVMSQITMAAWGRRPSA